MTNNAKTREDGRPHDTRAAPSRQPAEELLILCSRTRLSALEVARIKALLYRRIDWDRLIKLSCDHMISQLVYWHLSRVLPEEVPAAVLETLQGIFHSVLQRNLVLGGELQKLAKLFDVNGITMVPYKGPILAQQVYGNLALRPFIDIDLLIRKEDFTRVKKLLLAEGYESLYHRSTAEEEFRLLSDCEYHVVNPSNCVVVEIHWGVWEESVFPTQAVTDVLQRSQRSSFLGVNVLTLSPEDSLVFGCMHLAKHWWSELRLICDVAELIRAHPQTDWTKVVEIADELHCKRLLYLGISLAHDLLGASLPEGALTPIAGDARVIQVALDVEETLFEEHERRPTLVETYDVMRLQDRFRHKIHTGLWFILMPRDKDYEWLPLPRHLIKLYYVLRPLRLSIHYGRAFVRSML